MIMLNRLKFEHLHEYCRQNNRLWMIITEKTYNISFVNRKYLDNLIKQKILKIGQSKRNLERYERIFKK